MKKIKIKFITFALASAVIAVNSADSVTSLDKTAAENPTLTIIPRMNVEFQEGEGY